MGLQSGTFLRGLLVGYVIYIPLMLGIFFVNLFWSRALVERLNTGKRTLKIVRLPLFILAAYALAGWSAYVALLVRFWVIQAQLWAGVIYLVGGAFACFLGFIILAVQWRREERPGFLAVAMGAYLVFLIWPELASGLYNWLFSLLGALPLG